MVQAQKIEEAWSKRKIIDAKRARNFDGCSSNGSRQIQNKVMFKKMVSNPVPSMFPKAHDDIVSNPSLRREGVLFHRTRILVVLNVDRVILVNV